MKNHLDSASKPRNDKICVQYLGLMPYAEALKHMEMLHAEVASTPGHKGYLLVVEHPPTVTMGNRDNTHDLLISPEALRLKNIDYCKIDRGGSVTVHEPGQCVIYPIFNLFDSGHTVRSYVCALEEAMIQTCKHFGVIAQRDPKNPGIWVGDNKVGAIGIRVLNRVTKHGIAFNINNSLQTFSHIVPCGLRTKGVTSLAIEIAKKDPDSHASLNAQNVVEYLIQGVERRIERHPSP